MEDWSIHWLVEIYLRIISSAAFVKSYELADKMTKGMTKHNLASHAEPVQKLGLAIMSLIESIAPGTFTELEREFVAKLVLIAHDMGRGAEEKVLVNGKLVDIHEKDGAHAINLLLIAEGVPTFIRSVITYAIVNHRSSGILGRNALHMPDHVANEVLRSRMLMARRMLAVLVIADKCIGDKDRVRWSKTIRIMLLRFFGLSNYWFEKFENEDSRNNFANYAIKGASVVIDQTDTTCVSELGSIVLSIEIDERVCTMSQILSVRWFRDAFRCCVKAAKFLGFDFRIRTTSVNKMRADNHEEIWFWSAEDSAWAKRVPLEVPR